MDNILWIDAAVRADSRTRALAEHLLEKLPSPYGLRGGQTALHQPRQRPLDDRKAYGSMERDPMINSTLCYIERGDQWLLMHRVKKENDLNRDKWIGLGGKLEEGESPEECLLREVREEAGLTLTRFRYRGIVTFVSDRWEGEYMHLFTADGFEGTVGACDEGVLEWIKKSDFAALPQWEGDRIFLRLLEEGAPFFSLKLVYAGDALVSAALNGAPLPCGR